MYIITYISRSCLLIIFNKNITYAYNTVITYLENGKISKTTKTIIYKIGSHPNCTFLPKYRCLEPLTTKQLL